MRQRVISLYPDLLRVLQYSSNSIVCWECVMRALNKRSTHNDAWQIILQILPHFSSFFMYPLPKNRTNSVWYYNVHPSLTVSLSSVHPRKTLFLSFFYQIHYISNALNNNMRTHFINTKVNILSVSGNTKFGWKLQRIESHTQISESERETGRQGEQQLTMEKNVEPRKKILNKTSESERVSERMRMAVETVRCVALHLHSWVLV